MLLAARIAIIATSVFILVSWFLPAYWNWSVFDMRLVFPFNAILLAIAVILTIIPKLSAWIYQVKSKVLARFIDTLRNLPRIVGIALWIVIPVGVFYLLKSNSLILGDGHLIVSHVARGESISGTAFGYSMLIEVLGRIFHISDYSQAQTLMAWMAILCGMVFAGFVYHTLEILCEDWKQRTWFFLIIMTSGLSVIFAGYVETYPILLAWLSVYIYSSIYGLKHKTGLIIPAGMLLIGIFWHIWFVAFLPSLALLFNYRHNLVHKSVLAILTLAYIVAIYIGGSYLTRSDIRMVLAVTPSQDTHYLLFSFKHLIDFANIIFTVGPVLAIMAIILVFFRKYYRESERLRFLVWAAMPALLISFIIDPALGAYRDWDLLSIFALPLFLFGAGIFASQTVKMSKVNLILMPLLIINIVQFSSFIMSNKSPEKSVDRVVRLSEDDPHYQIDYYKGDRIRILAYLLSMAYDRHEDVIRLEERIAFSREDDYMSLLSIANAYCNTGDFNNACKYYEMVSDKVPFSNDNRIGYGTSLYNTGQYERSIDQFKTILYDTAAHQICAYLGSAYLSLNQPDSGQKYFDLGVTIADDSIRLMKSYVSLLVASGYYSMAEGYQERLLKTDPFSYDYQQRLKKLREMTGDTLRLEN